MSIGPHIWIQSTAVTVRFILALYQGAGCGFHFAHNHTSHLTHVHCTSKFCWMLIIRLRPFKCPISKSHRCSESKVPCLFCHEKCLWQGMLYCLSGNRHRFFCCQRRVQYVVSEHNILVWMHGLKKISPSNPSCTNSTPHTHYSIMWWHFMD
jgi:hypothetical protein